MSERRCAVRIIARARRDSLRCSVAFGRLDMLYDPQAIARVLAQHCVQGAWDRDEIERRLIHAFGRSAKWIRNLATELDQQGCRVEWPSTSSATRPCSRKVERWILASSAFQKAARRETFCLPRIKLSEPRQLRPSWLDSTPLPELATWADLAEWLQVSARQLRWLQACESDPWSNRVRHYRYRFLRKRAGQFRMLEAPKARLKQCQRRIHVEILSRIPVHPRCHGFVAGRSRKSFAEPHVGQPWILRLDLRDFFPSIGWPRVFGIFRGLGYPEQVARALADLTTTRTPTEIGPPNATFAPPQQVQSFQNLFGRRHLPQGAPSSPGLANLAAFRLDCRLHGLAGKSDLEYSRYADDLVLSSNRKRLDRKGPLVSLIQSIVLEEGFLVQFHKTSLMGRHQRQQVAGVVVNQHPNVGRREFDRLKATLFQLAQQQQQDAAKGAPVLLPAEFQQLQGQVAAVAFLNASKGKKLHALLSQLALGRRRQ